MTKIEGIKACVFDAYGTLFDVHAAAARCRQDIGDKADRLSAIWRTKQLEYPWLRSLMKDYKPFWEVTQDALDYAMAAVGLNSAALREKLLALYWELDAYPEVPSVLAKLRAGGFKTAILSNGSPDMLNGAIASAGLTDLLDDVQSVAEVEIFKPDARVYGMCVDRLSIEPSEICFMSANGWDAHGAAHFGFQVVWVNRFGQPKEYLSGRFKSEIATLEDLPKLLGC
jgi:2-haloacid dehalogenase